MTENNEETSKERGTKEKQRTITALVEATRSMRKEASNEEGEGSGLKELDDDAILSITCNGKTIERRVGELAENDGKREEEKHKK